MIRKSARPTQGQEEEAKDLVPSNFAQMIRLPAKVAKPVQKKAMAAPVSRKSDPNLSSQPKEILPFAKRIKN